MGQSISEEEVVQEEKNTGINNMRRKKELSGKSSGWINKLIR